MPRAEKQNPNGKPARINPTAEGVIGRIRPLGFDDSDGLKVLLYGQSGSGKTTLWGTFPRPILAVICSGSENPGELRSIDTPENREDIDNVALQHSDELLELTRHLKSLPGRGYGTVVLDHASGFQDLVLRNILNIEEVPATKGWGFASQQDYGQATIRCKELLRGLISLPCNVVIVAQERIFNDEGKVSEVLKPTVGAGLMPNLAGWLNSTMDYVCQTFKRQRVKVTTEMIGDEEQEVIIPLKGVEYCLRTAPHETFHTKFRIPKGRELPDVIVDPSYDKILSLVKGEPARVKGK